MPHLVHFIIYPGLRTGPHPLTIYNDIPYDQAYQTTTFSPRGKEVVFVLHYTNYVFAYWAIFHAFVVC